VNFLRKDRDRGGAEAEGGEETLGGGPMLQFRGEIVFPFYVEDGLHLSDANELCLEFVGMFVQFFLQGRDFGTQCVKFGLQVKMVLKGDLRTTRHETREREQLAPGSVGRHKVGRIVVQNRAIGK
jgi:hypothetical protein